MNRIRIAFVLPTLNGGGAERVFVHILRHLDRERFAPSLVIGRLCGAYIGSLPPDVPVHELGAERARSAAAKLLRVLRMQQPDIAFGTLGFGALLPALRPVLPRDVRVVSRVGSIMGVENGEKPAWQRGALRRALRLCFLGADAIVCQSDAMLLDAASYLRVPADRLKRIYNPVDEDSVDQLASELVPVTATGYPKLLAVGRLHVSKGFDRLLRAVAQIRPEFPALHLTILGEGPERGSLEALRSSLGLDDAVSLPGFAQNPYAHMRQSDLVVACSSFEGLPNALIEAQALGTPVVAADCPGGVREVVVDDVTGVLAPAGREDALRDALRTALARLGTFDRQRIMDLTRNKFARERIMGEYERLFIDITRGSSHGAPQLSRT